MNNELKPYGEYKKSEANYITEYPAHWEITKLRFIFEERKEKNKGKKTENVLSVMKNIGVIPYSEKGNVGNKCSDDIERYNIVYEDDIIMNCMNIIIGSVGRSKYYGALSPVYYVLKNRDVKSYNAKYYENVFRMTSLQRELTKYGKGILAHRMRIPMELLKNIDLPLPPKDEQDLIVKYINNKLVNIDRLIKAKKKQISLLKEQLQTEINNAVTKGIKSDVIMKSSGISWIGDIPKDWKLQKFSRVAQVKSNLVHPSDYSSYIQVSPENIEKNTGRLLECKTVLESGIISDNHLFYEGQILYSKVRPKLNKVTIAPFNGLCSADMYPIETRLDTKYLLYYMLSDIFLMQLAVTDNRVKMPKINKAELASIIIVEPPESVQIELVRFIEERKMSVNRLINALEKEIELITEYKIRLISDVVTGKVDVRNIKIDEIQYDDEEIEEAEDEIIEGEEDIEIEESEE